MGADQRKPEDSVEQFLEWLDEISFQLGRTTANRSEIRLSWQQAAAILEVLDHAADEAELEWQEGLFERLLAEAFRGYGYEALSQRCAS